MNRMILCSGITADQPTACGNIYPREVLNRTINAFNARAQRRDSLGGELDLDKIDHLGAPTHLTKRLFLNDVGMLCAEIEPMDTPEGRQLAERIRNTQTVSAIPIMSVPAYVSTDGHPNGPATVDEVYSIVRIQVDCNDKSE